jgi:hypothetical protein
LLRQQQVLDVRQSTSPVALLLGFGKRRQKQTAKLAKMARWQLAIGRSHDRKSQVKPMLPNRYIRHGQFGPS